MVQTLNRVSNYRRAEVGPLGLVTTGGRVRSGRVVGRRGRRGRTLAQAMLALLVGGMLLLTGTMAMARRNGAMKPAFPSQVAVTVQSGDTLWKLAHRYGDPHQYILERVDDLANENNLASDSILQPGQRILIPVHNAGDYDRITEKLKQI